MKLLTERHTNKNYIRHKNIMRKLSLG